ncbi:MAG: hypothetical protein [psittacine adenovirus 7]|uniref:Uncharacterized protein n=1 Tax=psittacine adenovirus 7 TaxID=2848040 RepID=A0A6B9LJL5_9ADEN|nr:MAG: hypothetical protein QKN13_gp23 [psittacine adenovirus 7]QHB43566.1 MAG: hypothetical protein [psittacine adenovirus 7]
MSSDETDDGLPIQDARISSVNKFFSGTRRTFPHTSEMKFVYRLYFPDTGVEHILLERVGTYKLSEYNFGTLFLEGGDVLIEFKYPFHCMFEAALERKWPALEPEYAVNIYEDQGIAVYEFPNIYYWPAILVWFAWQCLMNDIPFFDYCRLLNGNAESSYGTIFA